MSINTYIQFKVQLSLLCGNNMIDEWAEEDIDLFPEIIDAVADIVNSEKEHNFKIGEIKMRYSNTVEDSYLSFGCYHCDALFGNWFLPDEKREALNSGAGIVFKRKISFKKLTVAGNQWCYSENKQFCELIKMLKIDYLTFYRNGQKINESCERINLVIGGNNSGKTTFLNDIYRELKILHAHPPDVFWTFGHKLTFEAKEPELKKMFPNLLDQEDNFINFDQINKNVFVLTGKEEIINWSRATQDLLRKSKDPKYEVITTYGY